MGKLGLATDQVTGPQSQHKARENLLWLGRDAGDTMEQEIKEQKTTGQLFCDLEMSHSLHRGPVYVAETHKTHLSEIKSLKVEKAGVNCRQKMLVF